MAARRDWPFLIALAALFVFIFAIQARLSYDSLDEQIHITARARLPFQIAEPAGTVENVHEEATDAGLANGDVPVSLGGREIRGSGELVTAINAHHPGDVVPAVVTRDGRAISATIRIAPISPTPFTTADWLLPAFLDYLTPWFCICLGFLVAFLRPRDILAWLLLLLMLSFKEVAVTDDLRLIPLGWTDSMRAAAVFSASLLGSCWPIAMLLFGQYFPDRSPKGIWNRGLRWLLGAPLTLVALASAIVSAAEIDNARAIESVAGFLHREQVPILVIAMFATGTFFFNISRKVSLSRTSDDKRRLKLTYVGTTISLTPLFLFVVGSMIFKYDLTGMKGVFVPAFAMLFLFPLTLAYVIVVEKAMELRVVIRQGLQYALAKRGLRVLMAVAILAVILIAVRVITDPAVRRPQQLMALAVMVVIVLRLRNAAEWLRGWIDRRFFREAVNAERILTELGESVRTIVEVQPLLATVTKTISTTMHVPRVAALLRENGDYAPAQAVGFAAMPQVKFSAQSPVAERLARSREPERVWLARPDSWVTREFEDRKQLEQLQTELLLPLAVKDRLLGFLSLGPKLSEEPYSPGDVQLLESVAAQTGLALENTRLTEAVANEVAQRERLNRELEIAREVQQRLFPQEGPVVPGFDYAGKCRPASSVGGDYYDFVAMCDGRLGIAIGDISGKGVPAALLMASLQASLRGLAISNPPALSTLMENLNRLIYDASPSNKYATFFYGVYDPKTHEFTYVNGGHNPPMIFRGAEVLRLEDGGPVVGLFGPARYTQSSIQLQSGDTLVLFTDGVSEAMNNEDEEFDEPRLIDAVRRGANLSASGLIDHLMEVCDDFAAGAPQHDDMTLVIARVT